MLDVESHMYASTQMIDEYFAQPGEKKPFVQCEFIHAMGNGPGISKTICSRYINMTASAAALSGSECDHATYEGRAENGKEMFHYGGDAGEFPHDGNFCMDGLVYPDRRPHEGLYGVEKCYPPHPRRAYRQEERHYPPAQQAGFQEPEGIISICAYEIKKNGVLMEEGILDELEAEPHGFMDITLKLPAKTEERCYLKLTYYQKAKDKLTQVGHEMGFDQFALSEEKGKRAGFENKGEPLTLTETPEACLGNEFPSLRIREKEGNFIKLERHGEALVTAPVEWNVYRPHGQ